MNEPSVAYQLFHRHFSVRIPEMFCYSDVQLETLGRPTTGNKEIDDQLMRTIRDMYVTPLGLLTYFEEGSPIWFNTRDDVRTIYELIQEHLNSWYYVACSHIGVEFPPLEDFIRMDSFAEAIFPLTQYTKDKPLQLGLKAKMRGFSTGSLRGLSARITTPQETSDSKNNTAKRHESCIIKLMERLSNTGMEL